MIGRFLSVFEPFILMLLGTVVLASLLPARGEMATIVGYAADIGIVLLFFLHGAKLSRDQIVTLARNSFLGSFLDDAALAGHLATLDAYVEANA